MEKKMENEHGKHRGYLWLAGNEGMEEEMEITTEGYTGTTIKILSFVPC